MTQDTRKLWLVRNYKAYSDTGVPPNEPEKYLLAELASNKNADAPTVHGFKEYIGLCWEVGGELVRTNSIPLIYYYDINSLISKLMTFVDATVAEKEQKEATKKLITRTVWDHFNEITKGIEQNLGQAKEIKEIN